MPTTKTFSPDEMSEVIRAFVQKAGSLKSAADQLSTSSSHLSEILSGERTVGDRLASQLGFQKVKTKVTAIFYIGEKV